MLCREGAWMVGCDAVVGGSYVTLTIRRTGRASRIGLGEVRAVTYEELSGKLILELDGRTIEMLPQTTEDRDTVTKLVMMFNALENPAILDVPARVLELFCRSVGMIFDLVSELRETDRGFDWGRIAEVAGTLAGTLEPLGITEVGLGGELKRLADSVSGRDIRGTFDSAKSILVRVYEKFRLDLAKSLPGTGPEVLLDLALASVVSSRIRRLGVTMTERGRGILRELERHALTRFANVMNVEDLGELERAISSAASAEEFVDRVIGIARRSLLAAGRLTPREGGRA